MLCGVATREQESDALPFPSGVTLQRGVLAARLARADLWWYVAIYSGTVPAVFGGPCAVRLSLETFMTVPPPRACQDPSRVVGEVQVW